MYNCDICGLEFSNPKIKANHVRWMHRDNTKYLSNVSRIKCENDAKRLGQLIVDDVNCAKCSSLITVEYREGRKKTNYYCSRSCANSRVRTESFKTLVSLKIKTLWKNGHYDNTSRLSHLKNSKLFSSKNERIILEYFKSYYPLDEWTSGGGLKIDNKQISRDMYSTKLKICFEYDGDWHFIDIKGQLKLKQEKDALLEGWCIENNWRLIRIDERSYKNVNQIESLIYNNNDQIVKVGNRY